MYRKNEDHRIRLLHKKIYIWRTGKFSNWKVFKLITKKLHLPGISATTATSGAPMNTHQEGAVRGQESSQHEPVQQVVIKRHDPAGRRGILSPDDLPLRLVVVGEPG